MNTEYAERMALRNLVTLGKAQATRDNAAEPLMSAKAAELAEWAEHLTMLANDVLALIGRAERAADVGQLEAARDMLECAAKQLGDA